MEEIFIGKTFIHPKYGEYKIVSEPYFRNGNRNNKYIKVQFTNSGSITEGRLFRVIHNQVRDPLYGISLTKIYYSDNYGPYKVLQVFSGKVHQQTTAEIIFLNTGNRKIVNLFNTTQGNICDENAIFKIPLDTTLLSEDEKNKRIYRFLYSIFLYMKKRCTNPSAENYNYYGGQNISICDRWNDVNNFIIDAKSLFQYEKFERFPTIYQLDKDYKQLNVPKEQRIYSPETCVFLHYMDNINLRTIEMKRDHPENFTSKYFGVARCSHDSRYFSATIIVNNIRHYLGNFNNEEAAACMYNHWHCIFHNYELVPLFNRVENPILPGEFCKYMDHPKKMYRLI